VAIVSGERGDSGDVPADDQRLQRLSALKRLDRLDVGHVPNDVVCEQDPVAAEKVSRLGSVSSARAGGRRPRGRSGARSIKHGELKVE
jgi:hypothetical protein